MDASKEFWWPAVLFPTVWEAIMHWVFSFCSNFKLNEKLNWVNYELKIEKDGDSLWNIVIVCAHASQREERSYGNNFEGGRKVGSMWGKNLQQQGPGQMPSRFPAVQFEVKQITKCMHCGLLMKSLCLSLLSLLPSHLYLLQPAVGWYAPNPWPLCGIWVSEYGKGSSSAAQIRFCRPCHLAKNGSKYI